MMYVLLPILISAHGLVHLIGVASAFGYAKSINISVSKRMGIIWLLAFAFFIICTILIIAGKDWWIPGITGIILSEVLIISVWRSARFGSIANALVLLAVVLNFSEWKFVHFARRDANVLLTGSAFEGKKVTMNDLGEMPPVVQKWLTRSGVVGRAFTNTLRLKQKGQLRTAADATWMHATAEQYFTTKEPAFLWIARIASDFVPVSGRDEYENGRGWMVIKLGSVFTIANATGAEIDQGSMIRYLAEIQWFPAAALSTYIRWVQKDSLSAVATMSYKGIIASGTFFFNNDGDIIDFEAMRYMEHQGSYSLERWRVPITGYATFEGIRVPSKGEAVWELKQGGFTWFRWEVTDINYNVKNAYGDIYDRERD